MTDTTVNIDQETLNQIKAELMAERDRLLAEMAKITGRSIDDVQHSTKFPEYGDKPDENAQEIDNYSTNLATEKILEDNLRDVSNALQRIEEGKYGTCKYCGNEINPKRLIARPVASACIECKNKLQAAQ
ncbi:MAG: TraR/DksA family transcriptional regulator [Candidatus Falkowbacteria bacterium]